MASDRVRGDKIHKTVILDTSAILMFFEFSVDWERQLGSLLGAYHLLVPTAVVQELQTMERRRNGQKKAAAALKLVEKYERIGEEAPSADEALLKIAEKTQGIVVTNDMKLRQQLKNHGCAVIF
ncbi:MAG: PIN domain-containing protein, partial [Candidatus Thermoplasmatota archaeon]|nr:PIN domain-containing protein [Candidatus Thermoplasmatota archaeon]